MIWDQNYLLFGRGLAFSAAVAAIPVVLLMVLLGVLRKPAWISGLSGLAAAFLLAIGAYHMPVSAALSAAADGAAFALFPVTWIIFGALALYHVSVETGKFAIIKATTGRLTSDSRLQGILIAFAFGAFLEGAAGFGTPVAIAAAMLTGLGFSAYRASSICLLANAAPGAYGAIGIPVVTLAGITGLDLNKLGAATAWLCAPLSFLMPGYLVVAMGGWSALSGLWLPVLLIGGVFAGTQLAVNAWFGPQLTDILASLAAMLALILLLRFWRPPERHLAARMRDLHGPGGTPGASVPTAAPGSAALPNSSDDLFGAEPVLQPNSALHRAGAEMALYEPLADDSGASSAPIYTMRDIVFAWLPYALLVACVLLWGIKPVPALLGKATIVVPWPGLHNLVRRMPPAVAAPTLYPALFNFNWLSAAGTACMLAAVLSAACLGMRPAGFLRMLGRLCRQLMLPTVTVTSVLALAFLMNYSGATATLGLIFAATGAAFPFFGVCLGWLGVFLTGSDTSGNALFGGLQTITAARLGFSPVMMAAANAAGGAVGKMISLQSIAVAAAATGISAADQARLFRFALKHSLVLITLLGALALLYAYVLHLS